MMIVNAWIGLANSRAVEYGTPEKIHLNALFWKRSKSSLILEEHNGKQDRRNPMLSVCMHNNIHLHYFSDIYGIPRTV
jgi:hypothetical protein